MPFTPSHAAAVLPFLRTPLPASALVIGSIAPDLPFHLPVDFPWRTHTAQAVVTSPEGEFRFFAAPGTWKVRSLAPVGKGERVLDAELGLNETTVVIA